MAVAGVEPAVSQRTDGLFDRLQVGDNLSGPWHRRQLPSYTRWPESSAALPTVHVQTAITTTRAPNTARVADLLVIRLATHTGRVRLRIADGKLVVRLDQFSIPEG